jgi:hypothetical protein
MTTAAVMTYDSLVEDISSYLERTDQSTLDKIPTFVMLAEQVLAAELKFLGTLTVNTSTMNIGVSVLDKPARWRKTVSMNITDATGTRYPMLLRKYEYLREYWPDSTAKDLPKFYCDYDYTHWLISPTPDAAYDFEVLYYERPQPLDSSNQSNWFTQYAPQALLYGSLLQTMPFLKNDGRTAMWQQQYDIILTALKAEDVTRLGDRQSMAVDS